MAPVKRYRCDLCFYEGPLKRKLVKHMLDAHLKPKVKAKAKCEICEEEFRNRYQLAQHQKSHEGFMVTKCKWVRLFLKFFKPLFHHCLFPINIQIGCNDIFVEGSRAQKSHFQIKHKKKKPRWKCDFCEVSSSNSFLISKAKHIKQSHSEHLKPVRCEICFVKVATPLMLTKHLGYEI